MRPESPWPSRAAPLSRRVRRRGSATGCGSASRRPEISAGAEVVPGIRVSCRSRGCGVSLHLRGRRRLAGRVGRAVRVGAVRQVVLIIVDVVVADLLRRLRHRRAEWERHREREENNQPDHHEQSLFAHSYLRKPVLIGTSSARSSCGISSSRVSHHLLLRFTYRRHPRTFHGAPQYPRRQPQAIRRRQTRAVVYRCLNWTLVV